MIEQLSFTKTNSCAFSGNRKLLEDFSVEILEREIVRAIKNGVKKFYVGMAEGFDLFCGELVIKNKKEGIQLVACIPHPLQNIGYKKENEKRYQYILENADEKVVICDNPSKWSYLKRNEYMEQNAEMLICYNRKKRGGTKHTISLFEKNNKKIIYL